MSGVAVNPQTGEVLVLSQEGAWEPARRARNPQTGEELFNDGAAWRPVPRPEAPRPPDEGMRQIGLGTRATAQGLASLPGAVYDAAGGVINAGVAGLEALGLPALPRVRTARENVSSVADAVGLPAPATPTERMIGAGVEGVASVLPSMGAGLALQTTRGAPAALNTLAQSPLGARVLPEGVRAALPATAQTMGQNGALTQALLGPMSTQIAAGAGGGLAQQAVAEGGGGVGPQVLASLMGGVAGAAGMEGLRGTGRLAGAMVEPFSEAGRQRIASEALLATTSQPETLAARLRAGLENTDGRLPGSVPTTATAARDPTMMSIESSVRSGALGPHAKTIIGDADIARTDVRRNALEALGDNSTPDIRGQGVRETLRDQRGEVGKMVNAAYESVDPDGLARFPVGDIRSTLNASIARLYGPGSGGPPSQLTAVLNDLPRDAAGPRTSMDITMNRPASAAPAEVDWRFLQNLRSRLGNIAGEAARNGDNRLASAAGRAWDEVEQAALQQRQPEAVQGLAERWNTAQAFRRQMGDMYERAPTGANASGTILNRDSFGNPMLRDDKVPDTALRSVADVQQVLQAAGPNVRQVRAQLRGQFMENLMDRTTLNSSVTNSAGEISPQLSVSKFQQFFSANEDVAAQIFEPGQLRQMRRIVRDFTEGSVNANTGATRNSMTAQNLSVGNLIARASNGLVASDNASFRQAFGWLRHLYGTPEAMTRDMLVRSLVDPGFAEMLLTKATPQAMDRVVTRLTQGGAQQLDTAARAAALRQTTRTAPELSQPQE